MEFQKKDAFTLKEKIESGAVALLPLGATEIHGAHLPTGTDTMLAEGICQKLCEKVNALILPAISYTQVWSLGDFTGSVSISNALLTALLEEVLTELYRNGFRTACIVNAHLGNLDAMKQAGRAVMKHHADYRVLSFTYPDTKDKIKEVMNRQQFHGDFFHADEIETSYMLYLCEDFVDMDKAVNAEFTVPELINVMPVRWSTFTQDAVMGNAKDAAKEKGRAVIEHTVEVMTRYINMAEGR